ncbi:MAG: hypothetical protein J1E81_06045 [Eubacterium sp.]|nr:hypothetical protein [Eubacterium sp.]
MSVFVKLKSKWGYVALGVGTVVGDSNGNVLSETEANEYGDAKLKFKAIGAWHLSKKTNELGEKIWENQSLWCSCEKDSPLAAIVNSLSAGDMIFVFGKLRKSSYKNYKTGRIHRNAFCNLSFIQVISHGNGDLAKPPSDVAANETDDIDDLDF